MDEILLKPCTYDQLKDIILKYIWDLLPSKISKFKNILNKMTIWI